MPSFDLSLLEELVNINSQTHNVHGVTLAQKLVAKELQNLGMQIHWHKNIEATSADAMVATYGDGPLIVTLLGHTDTVAKGGEFFPFQKTNDGLITGAGIADMKAGVAIIVDALTAILPVMSDEITLKVVLSPNEEIGSTGFHDLFKELGQNSQVVLCFEPALEDGSFIHGRNGNRWYDINISGEKFHTGRAPKGSDNVLHQLCKLYTKLEEYSKQFDGLKFNMSSISSDSNQHNVSSSDAHAKMDVRFASTEQRDGFHRHLKNWLSAEEIEAEIKIVDDCPPLENSGGIDVLSKMSEIIHHPHKHCEGASDANYFSTSHNIVLDGLGARGKYFHSRKEFIQESSLAQRSMALAKFLISLPAVKIDLGSISLKTKTA